jgi:hypothetical protein
MPTSFQELAKMPVIKIKCYLKTQKARNFTNIQTVSESLKYASGREPPYVKHDRNLPDVICAITNSSGRPSPFTWSHPDSSEPVMKGRNIYMNDYHVRSKHRPPKCTKKRISTVLKR